MKTYQPIHSDNPEERFVVEKATMGNPEYLWENETMRSSGYWYKKEEYEKHLASLTKYPFPALPADCPDEMIEGRDFRLQHQESYHRYNFNNWHNVSKPAHDEVFESTSIVHRRIIAVPLSVKSGEEKQAWELVDHKDCLELVKSSLSAIIAYALQPKSTYTVESIVTTLKKCVRSIDASLDAIPTQSGESMEDVYVWLIEESSAKSLGERYSFDEVVNLMQRWASIQLSTKEAAIKELAQTLERIIEFQEENITKLTSAQILVHINNYIGSVITKHKPTTP